MQRLPDDSLTQALIQGGREHFGWGTNRILQADIFDAINQNTRASGSWGKKGPPDIKPWPRPNAKDKKKKKERVTVAQLFGRFARL